MARTNVAWSTQRLARCLALSQTGSAIESIRSVRITCLAFVAVSTLNKSYISLIIFIDMASLSFHTSVLLTEQRPRFSHEWDLGYLETKFLQLLISEKEEMEPLMSNCQRMFVFHVTTEYPYWKTRQVPISMEKQDNLHSKITASV